jgi:hypothetical protein
MLNAIRNVYRSYTDDELNVIARFMTEVAAILRQETASLQPPGRRDENSTPEK